MIVFFIILIVSLGVWIGILAIAYFLSERRSKERFNFLQKANEDLKEARQLLIEEKEKSFKNGIVEERTVSLDERICEKEELLKEGQKRLIECEDKLNEYKDKLNEYEEKLNEYEGKLSNAAMALYGVHQSYQDESGKLHGVLAEKEKIFERKNDMEKDIETLKPYIEGLKEDLKILQGRKREALLREKEVENDLWELDVSNREKELIEILKRIKIDYPDLSIELSTIEWRKIWLPKLQDLCNEYGVAVRGIYRLVLKEDNKVCYIGQAVNIQQRWYEHVKKMIGVDSKGGEKLYKYRPEDFYWSIIERDCKDLNESERYWIEFYGCKEIGLNRK